MTKTKNKSNKMREWMAAATTAEQTALADAAGTSRMYLYHLSVGFRTASAELAGRIEKASKAVRKQSKGRLPVVTRTDLSPACAGCPYAAKCKRMR